MYPLSIVIPTHNRQQYALDAVTTILANFPQCEVVVTDTSESDKLGVALDSTPGRSRLVYDRPGRRLDVVANYENGFRLSTGEYLVFLGDDDCLGPGAESISEWAAANRIDAIGCTLPASYGWPDFYSRHYGSGYAAKLAIRPFSGRATAIDSKSTLVEALHNFGGGVMRMPRAYLGMISRGLADRITSKYGTLFGGVSPDIYSAAIISAESQKAVSLDFPFIIPGSSGASTSGFGASGRHVGVLRENPHLGAFTDLVWDELIPEFYSVPTVWAFSLKKAVDRISGDLAAPNFARLYVKCLLFHPAFIHEIRVAMANYLRCSSRSHLLPQMAYELSREVASQVKRVSRRVRYPRATADAVTFERIQSVGEAYGRLAEHVAKVGRSFASDLGVDAAETSDTSFNKVP